MAKGGNQSQSTNNIRSELTKEVDKFQKAIEISILATFIIGCTGTNQLLTYILFVLLAINGLKMFTEPKLYDMFVLTMMLIFKIVIEFIIVLFFYNIFGLIFTTFIFEMAKIIILLIFKNKISKLYIKFDKIWYKNNFYIVFFL